MSVYRTIGPLVIQNVTLKSYEMSNGSDMELLFQHTNDSLAENPENIPHLHLGQGELGKEEKKKL